MTLRRLVLAAVMFSMPLAAHAQAVSGLYFGFGAGRDWSKVEDSSRITGFSAIFADPSPTELFDPKRGSALVGSIGYGFGNGFRVELEANRRTNRIVTSYTRTGGLSYFPLSTDGDATTTAGMFNAFYDIGATQGWPVHITLGAGIGYGRHSWDNVGTVVSVAPTQRWIFGDSDRGLAYQGIAGLALPIKTIPGLALTGEYRYFSMKGLETVDGRLSNGATSAPISVRAGDNNHQSLMVGLRYSFGGTR